MFKSPKTQIMFFAVLLAATSVCAQDTKPYVLTEPRMVVIPVRSLDEVNADIKHAEADKQGALDRKAQADSRLKEIDKAIETRKNGLEDTDRRKSDAKKGKRDSEVIALQLESKASKQAIDLLKSLKDLREAEIEEAKAEIELADNDVRVLRLESELQSKRAEYELLTTTDMGDLTHTLPSRFSVNSKCAY